MKENQDNKPTSDKDYYEKGNEYRKQNNWKMALESYSEAIAINPGSPAVQAKEMILNILNYRCKEMLNP